MFYTATRLAPAAFCFVLWLWLADGTLLDPINALLLFAGVAAIFGLAVVRRYWIIRNTSRSRHDSSLLA